MASAPSSAVPPSATSHGMAVGSVSDADGTVVWLHGEHDVATEAAVSEVMAGAIAGDDADLVVDLSGVKFMDGSTVGVIMRAHDLLRRRSRSLSVQDPSRCARRMLDLCGLAALIGPASAIAPEGGSAEALATWVAVPPRDADDRGPRRTPSASGTTDSAPAARSS